MSARPVSSALVSLVVLAAWTGAAVFVAAVVAPAAFAALPSRALAGQVIGRTLPALFVSGILVGLVVAVVRPLDAGRFVTGGAATLAVASAGALLVEFRLRAMQLGIGAPLDSLAVADPRRVAFGRLHGVSVLLMGIGIVGAVAAIAVIARAIGARNVA
ncbi:MAG: DUF4149 domain-containing protein [bacterium]